MPNKYPSKANLFKKKKNLQEGKRIKPKNRVLVLVENLWDFYHQNVNLYVFVFVLVWKVDIKTEYLTLEIHLIIFMYNPILGT